MSICVAQVTNIFIWYIGIIWMHSVIDEERFNLKDVNICLQINKAV